MNKYEKLKTNGGRSKNIARDKKKKQEQNNSMKLL